MNQNDESVSAWLERLPDGDSVAQSKIWDRYAESVSRMAKRFLSGVQLRESDEEDVAIQVLDNLYAQMVEGNFREPITNRKQLWALLIGMTKNKAKEAARGKRAQKRGEGKVRGESVFINDNSRNNGIEQAATDDNDPRDNFFHAEQFEEILDYLESEDLRRAVLLRLAGYTNLEVAQTLQESTRAVERKFQRIRELLTEKHTGSANL